MKISLLFGIFPNEIFQQIIDSSKGPIQYAADALQKAYIKGFAGLNMETLVINLPYIGSYPLRYKKLYSPNNAVYTFKTSDSKTEISIYNTCFCNLIGYKMLSRYTNAYCALKHWCEKYPNEEKVLIIYAIHTPFLKACTDIKNHFKNVKIIQIVPDLPEYMNDKCSYIKEKLLQLNEKYLYELYRKVDAYILLSKYMINKLPMSNTPYDIIEGIYDESAYISTETTVTDKPKEKIVLYSGTLAKRYGVLNLVDAFMKLDEPDCKLMICGAGDSEQEIKQKSLTDNRIIFLGQKPREEVLSLQKKAYLLVNPRTPEGEFTKYSFPSKTMEYFASGTPTLIYKLPGIPDEYYKYSYTITELGVNNLYIKLNQILQLDYSELYKKGLAARDFILQEKTPQKQVLKVLNLIKQL